MTRGTKPTGMRACSMCGAVKPEDLFYRNQTHCKTCSRLYAAEYRKTSRYRAWRERYAADPGYRARQTEQQAVRRRTPAGRAKLEERRREPLAKIRAGLAQARYRLKRVRTESARERLRAVATACEAEIARMELALSGDRKRGRPRKAESRAGEGRRAS